MKRTISYYTCPHCGKRFRSAGKPNKVEFCPKPFCPFKAVRTAIKWGEEKFAREAQAREAFRQREREEREAREAQADSETMYFLPGFVGLPHAAKAQAQAQDSEAQARKAREDSEAALWAYIEAQENGSVYPQNRPRR